MTAAFYKRFIGNIFKYIHENILEIMRTVNVWDKTVITRGRRLFFFSVLTRFDVCKWRAQLGITPNTWASFINHFCSHYTARLFVISNILSFFCRNLKTYYFLHCKNVVYNDQHLIEFKMVSDCTGAMELWNDIPKAEL